MTDEQKEEPTTSAVTSTITSTSNSVNPKVVICGGGPAGILTSILLDKISIQSTVLEKAAKPDEWSSKSYSMVCGETGQGALSRGGCLEYVREAGNKRSFMYVMDGMSGKMSAIPRRQKTPGIGFSRPLLVECLEKFASDSCPGVTIRRGAGVVNVTNDDGNNDRLQVNLDDGTVVSATHVIGADGKWSKVRQSFSSLNSQMKMVTCPSFGVSLYISPSDTPPEWKDDGTYVVRPPEECMFYIIVSHLPAAAGGGMSISMVCYDQTVEKYPWLEPPADLKPGEYGKGGWEDELSAIPEGILKSAAAGDANDVNTNENLLSDHLEQLFQEVVPEFHALLTKDVYNTARVNRRVTWLKTEDVEGKEGKGVSYSTDDGLVTLVGDAAHAMTPSMGEGGNRAMESAVKLVDAVIAAMEEKEETVCTVDTMSEGFVKYGLSRPKEVVPVQVKSAAGNEKKL